MTVSQLQKYLTTLVLAGHERRQVCIDKVSFRHNLEPDGCVILEVCAAEMRTYPRIDDDGGIALRKDGTERMLTSVVLFGDSERSLK